MRIVVDIPESILNTIQADEMISREQLAVLQMHILNGTPLDKIRAGIKRQEKWLSLEGYTAYNADIAFDAIKSVLAESGDNE